MTLPRRPEGQDLVTDAYERSALAAARAAQRPPEHAFRDYVRDGEPASGPHNPFIGDGLLWAERLGLTHPRKWRRVEKAELRAACRRWLDENS